MNFKCPICNRFFETETGLTVHRRTDSICILMAEKPRMAYQKSL